MGKGNRHRRQASRKREYLDRAATNAAWIDRPAPGIRRTGWTEADARVQAAERLTYGRPEAHAASTPLDQ